MSQKHRPRHNSPFHLFPAGLLEPPDVSVSSKHSVMYKYKRKNSLFVRTQLQLIRLKSSSSSSERCIMGEMTNVQFVRK